MTTKHASGRTPFAAAFMNHKIAFGLAAAVVLFGPAARADSFDSLSAQFDHAAAAATLPRSPASTPVDVTWMDGTPDSLVNVHHFSIDDASARNTIYGLAIHYVENGYAPDPATTINDRFVADTYNLVTTQASSFDTNQRFATFIDWTVTNYTASAPIADPHNIDMTTKERSVGEEMHLANYQGAINAGGQPRFSMHWAMRRDLTCTYKSTSADVVHRTCKGSITSKGNSSEGATDSSNNDFAESSDFHWIDSLKVYLHYDFGTPFDIRYGHGRWASQDKSDKLSPAEKEQARQLFAKAFELYKGGDSTGAVALFSAGLQIDPANAQVWSILGDMHRAAYKTDQKFSDAFQEIRDYERVIDLAPTSSEAILARAHFAEWKIKYEDLGTAPSE